MPFAEVNNAGVTQRTGTGAAMTPGTWRHLAVTAGDGQINLYVDGNRFSSVAATLPTMAGPAQVGADSTAAAAAPADSAAPDSVPTPAPPEQPSADAAAVAPAAVGFVGDIDELQLAKMARSAGFIKAAAIGQGPENGKLISFSVDEETASWFSGYFAVILQSVTLDGWVVIGLLAIMAVISWVVIVDRVSYLNRTGRGQCDLPEAVPRERRPISRARSASTTRMSAAAWPWRKG